MAFGKREIFSAQDGLKQAKSVEAPKDGRIINLHQKIQSRHEREVEKIRNEVLIKPAKIDQTRDEIQNHLKIERLKSQPTINEVWDKLHPPKTTEQAFQEGLASTKPHRTIADNQLEQSFFNADTGDMDDIGKTEFDTRYKKPLTKLFNDTEKNNTHLPEPGPIRTFFDGMMDTLTLKKWRELKQGREGRAQVAEIILDEQTVDKNDAPENKLMKLLKYIKDNFGVEMTEDGPTSGFLNSNKRKYDKLLNTDTQFSELVDKFVQLKQEVANVVPKPKDDSKTTFVTQPLPGGARKEDGGTIRFDR